MTDLVDPEELPFTLEELSTAARKFMPAETARAMAEHLHACGPGVIKSREERRAGWRAAGVANADTMPLHAWVYPDELLPALASLSSNTEARALGLMAKVWQSNHAAAVHKAQEEAAEAAGLIPTREQILREAAAQRAGGGSLSPRGLAASVSPWPPQTPEMLAVADSVVAAQREVWRTTVARFRAISLNP